MPVFTVRGDLTKMPVDAVVNAANEALAMGGGVCGAIFRAAGPEKMAAACAAIGRCETGRAVLTEGFGLPAKYVIHTVGPVWHGGDRGEEAQLRACYRACMALAAERGFRTVAFPLISAGIYGYPKEQAYGAAVTELTSFLLETGADITAYVVLFE